jgi:hypothetical protein
MSKTFRSFLVVFAASVQILQFFTIAGAQDIDVRIGAVGLAEKQPAYFYFAGRFLDDARPNPMNLVLLNQYAGTAGLAERATVRSLTQKTGKRLAFKKLVAGEYLAETGFSNWNYDLVLAPFGPASAKAHVSWVAEDRGILMLNDVLPQLGVKRAVSARVKIEMPDTWQIVTTEREVEKNVFDVIDVDKAVFILSRNGNARVISVPDASLKLAIFGEWQFGDRDALAMAGTIKGSYEKIFGAIAAPNAVVSIMHFPEKADVGNWEADTRGNSITILSSDMPFKNQSVQRLHEQLRHEIFHLWIPNGVNLSGNYDWFYEGFALYQSLKSGVAANQLRFDDMLDSLAQAYNVDSMQNDRLSLIEASKNRWSGSNTRVYARGMLVAFLCDLGLLQRSKGKRSVEGLLREIYQKHHAAISQDGDEAVLSIMRTHPELAKVIDRYVSGKEKIDWQTDLLAAGIEAVSENSFVRLRAVTKPTGRQRDLLDELGYNNWRKLSESSK